MVSSLLRSCTFAAAVLVVVSFVSLAVAGEVSIDSAALNFGGKQVRNKIKLFPPLRFDLSAPTVAWANLAPFASILAGALLPAVSSASVADLSVLTPDRVFLHSPAWSKLPAGRNLRSRLHAAQPPAALRQATSSRLQLLLHCCRCAAGDAELRPSAGLGQRRPLLHGPAKRWRVQLQSTWAPPLLLFHVGWLPSLQTSKDQATIAKSKEVTSTCCRQGAIKMEIPGSHTEKGTRYKLFLLCTLRASKHGSGKATLCVRADLRPRSMLVLRFNVKNSGVNFLSPVKAIRYLRLKIPNPHRHRPIRQSRGAPTVLSECNKEDPRCLWRGHPSSTAQRPRRRRHLCLLLEKCIVQVFRPSDAFQAMFFYLSHCFGFAVVAQKLRLCLGWKIPNLCTLVLSA